MITIAFATETGTAEGLALDTKERFDDLGVPNQVVDLSEMKTEELQTMETFLAIVSTWGDGDPPSDSEDFFEELRDLESMNLPSLRFAVLALGDTSYDLFCQFGKDLEEQLARHGAEKMLERVDCDIDYEDPFDKWLDQVASILAPSEAVANT
ncbi:MAG: flavodoxin domain-containing protein [Verrucomicrobiota bacterium]